METRGQMIAAAVNDLIIAQAMRTAAILAGNDEDCEDVVEGCLTVLAIASDPASTIPFTYAELCAQVEDGREG
jgi:hypothetical protein